MMRVALAALGIAAVILALFFARPHATPGPPMRDFEAYYAAGETLNSGGNPYGTAVWEHERSLQGIDGAAYAPLPFVGPPATLPLWSAIAHLSFSTANALWRSILVCAVLALLAVALRIGGTALGAIELMAAAIFALGFGPLTSAVALGQVALVACACAALALFFKPAGILAWMQPNLALSLLSQTVRRSGALAFVSCAAVFGAACVAVAGAGGTLRYVQFLGAHASAERFSAIQITPTAIAYGFGASPANAQAAGAVVAIAAILIWLVYVRPMPDDIARFCATCALLPLAMPFFHEHDLVLVFLPALYFTLRCERRLWPLAAAGGLFAATDWLGLAQRPDGTVQTLLLIFAAGAALIVLRRDASFSMLAVPAAALALIGMAAFAAHAHAVPVWPDAMRAFHPASGASIASIWHDEQTATGLFAREPVWAILRCGSLLGCALLSSAAVLNYGTSVSRSTAARLTAASE